MILAWEFHTAAPAQLWNAEALLEFITSLSIPVHLNLIALLHVHASLQTSFEEACLQLADNLSETTPVLAAITQWPVSYATGSYHCVYTLSSI